MLTKRELEKLRRKRVKAKNKRYARHYGQLPGTPRMQPIIEHIRNLRLMLQVSIMPKESRDMIVMY